MSIQLLMAQNHPIRRGDRGSGRSAGPRNGANNGLPPLDTDVTNQPQATTPASFQGLGQEALQDYTNQLAYLEAQNRLRRQAAYEERRHRSQPGSPSSPRAAPSRWTPYPSEQQIPRSAIEPQYWSGSGPELNGGGNTSGSTSTSGSSGGAFSAGVYGASAFGAHGFAARSGSNSAVDPIQQYQQMLRVEQQRRIREMEETRRERERERLRDEARENGAK